MTEHLMSIATKSTGRAESPRAGRPNVILIVAHDLGDFLGCYGRRVRTPNLDRLASEGVTFTRHFTTSPFCSPARGSIITGTCPHTNGLMGLTNLGWDMPAGTVTDAMRFRDAGYRTFLVGFQHEMRDPARLGFEQNIGVGYAPCETVAANACEAVKALAKGGRSAPFYMRLGTRETHRLVAQDETWPYGFHEYRAEGLAPEDVEILPPWRDTPALRRDLADFTGSVSRLDRAIGTVMDALTEYGFAENTIVVFTADHGIDFPRAKGTLYDLGLRTALIMRHPKEIGGGRHVGDVTSHIDILPTLLDACGLPAVADAEGVSLLPLLHGTGDLGQQYIFAEESTYPGNLMRCVRSSQYKLIRNFCPGEFSNAWIMPGAPLLADAGNAYDVTIPELELYDLCADPFEEVNLAGGSEVRSVQSELTAQLQRWMKETGDPLLSGTVPRPPNEQEIIRGLPPFFTQNRDYMARATAARRMPLSRIQ
jgi:arylsulfatase A-like enzyme